MEFTLLGAAVGAAAALFGVLWYEDGRTNPADSTRRLSDAALVAAVAGLVVGRLASMISGGTNPIVHPGDILVIRGGVDTGFAAAGALGTLVLNARKELWQVTDGLAAAGLAGLAAWHAACLMRGGCLGTVSSLPWAVTADTATVSRHPVEIYTALLLVASAAGLIIWKRRRPASGIVAGAALAIAAGVRLATEPLRLGIGSGPEPWYAAGIVLGFGVWVARWCRRRGPA